MAKRWLSKIVFLIYKKNESLPLAAWRDVEARWAHKVHQQQVSIINLIFPDYLIELGIISVLRDHFNIFVDSRDSKQFIQPNLQTWSSVSSSSSYFHYLRREELASASLTALRTFLPKSPILAARLSRRSSAALMMSRIVCVKVVVTEGRLLEVSASPTAPKVKCVDEAPAPATPRLEDVQTQEDKVVYLETVRIVASSTKATWWILSTPVRGKRVASLASSTLLVSTGPGARGRTSA